MKEKKNLKATMMGKSPIQWFYEKGFLNERMILSHCVHVDEKDIDLIAETRAGVVNTPFSEMRLADGVAPIPEMLQKGILVCLGTDGGALNTAGDIFYEMKQICLLHSVSSGNPKAITPLQALKMATVFPARMFKQNSGMIAVGKAADIILLDQNNFAMLPVIKRPFNNIISSIVYSGSGNQVTDTIINGRVVMRDRKLITVNEEKIIAELNEAVEEITSKYDANEW